MKKKKKIITKIYQRLPTITYIRSICRDCQRGVGIRVNARLMIRRKNHGRK